MSDSSFQGMAGLLHEGTSRPGYESVTHVSEHLLPMSLVSTSPAGRGGPESGTPLPGGRGTGKRDPSPRREGTGKRGPSPRREGDRKSVLLRGDLLLVLFEGHEVVEGDALLEFDLDQPAAGERLLHDEVGLVEQLLVDL